MTEFKDRYYFAVGGTLYKDCIEPCLVQNNGVMIGSVKCQECEHCTDFDKESQFGVDWISCSRLIEASGREQEWEKLRDKELGKDKLIQ